MRRPELVSRACKYYPVRPFIVLDRPYAILDIEL